jgi:hypothetical protein
MVASGKVSPHYTLMFPFREWEKYLDFTPKGSIPPLNLYFIGSGIPQGGRVPAKNI